MMMHLSVASTVSTAAMYPIAVSVVEVSTTLVLNQAPRASFRAFAVIGRVVLYHALSVCECNAAHSWQQGCSST